MEGMRVEINAAEAIAESCGNDIRQVLNCLQMWANKRHDAANGRVDMTYKDIKDRESSINKDEILRVSMFDATRVIVEGRRGLANADGKAENDSLFKRSDAFFTDYSLMGLNVHQNYLKVMVAPFQDTKRKGDAHAELRCLERMHDATECMSDFAIAEHAVRSGDQQWGLLPLCSMLAVKTGFHAGGDTGGMLPGFPEFAGWLGKNSSRGRKNRLLQELGHHMNYRISGDLSELRLVYLPAFRERFVQYLASALPAVSETIELMDEYGLDRDDLFENFDEFSLDPKASKLANLDSKVKAAFTREYNKGVHKSQALVDEQGVMKSRSRKGLDQDLDGLEGLVGVDEDVNVIEDDGEDEEQTTVEAIQKLFKSITKAKAANNGGNSGKVKGKK